MLSVKSVSISVSLLELSVSDSGTIHDSLIICTEQVNVTSVLGQAVTTDSQGTLIAIPNNNNNNIIDKTMRHIHSPQDNIKTRTMYITGLNIT